MIERAPIPNHQGVEALAKVLSGYRVEIMEGRPADLRDLIAQRILANPGPMLEALAQAGVLEVRPHAIYDAVDDTTHDGRMFEHWEPVGGDERSLRHA